MSLTKGGGRCVFIVGKKNKLKKGRNKNELFFGDSGKRAKNVAGVAEMSLRCR